MNTRRSFRLLESFERRQELNTIQSLVAATMASLGFPLKFRSSKQAGNTNIIHVTYTK